MPLPSPLKKKQRIHGSNLVRGKEFDPRSDSPPTRPHREPMKKVPKVERRLVFARDASGVHVGQVLFVPSTPDRRFASEDDLIWTEV